MLFPEHHIGSLLEHIQDITSRCSCCRGKAVAPAPACADHELLQRSVRWRDLEAHGAVLAADPFPERVVAVQHDHFVGCLFQIEHHAEQRRADRGITLRRVRDMAQLMAVRIGIVIELIPADQATPI